ncbi:MAG: hypothetical protein LUC91_02600 [Prevotella sp.]|nr:hypothetical protein [Prevotella sp.]
MLDIIQNNPYRLLGVYANSSMRERLANITRIKAFLKVGKPMSFPTDFPSMLPQINRTLDAVTEAESQLSLPDKQIHYAQFWFLKANTVDEIAINHLIASDIENALSIWTKKDNASSLQNRIASALIYDFFPEAIQCAEKLYTFYKDDFIRLVLGENQTVDITRIEYDFLDELVNHAGTDSMLQHISNDEWKEYVSRKEVSRLIGLLQTAANEANASRKKGPAEALTAGRKLMRGTKIPMNRLKKMIPETDVQYQIIADKVGLAALQCGIDYYNHTFTPDTTMNTMELVDYALSVVMGAMAKARCRENVNIIQENAGNITPTSVQREADAVNREIQRFSKMPVGISSAVTLLNSARPYLQTIKSKLGATNAFYLKLSTKVVESALHNTVEEVNKEMTVINNESRMIFLIKPTLAAAWDATLIMDGFDMKSDFKVKYQNNRSTLENLCIQGGMPTVQSSAPRTGASASQAPRASTSASTGAKQSTSNSTKPAETNADKSFRGKILHILHNTGSILLKIVLWVFLVVYYGWFFIGIIVFIILAILGKI